MKMMPKKDLIELITHIGGNYISKDMAKDLFENYGDDYFKEGGFYSDWTLTNENEMRKDFMREVEKLEDSD